jgi:hypothetical protein
MFIESFPIIHISSQITHNWKSKSLEYREMSMSNFFRKLGFCKIDDFSYPSLNNVNDDDRWKIIKER